jgi:hypothetical protein
VRPAAARAKTALLCAGLCALTWRALGAQAAEPLREARWDAFPTPASRSAQDPRALYPDFSPAELARADYAELYDGRSRARGCITAQSQRLGYVSVIYYSPQGGSYLRVAGLPLPVRQQISVTFALPPREPGGLTRLVLWAKPPAGAALDLLLRQPLPRSSGMPGLLAEEWFPRQQPVYGDPPWEDPLRRPPAPPSGFLGADWPLCQAVAQVDKSVVSKDCAVRYVGLAGFGLDESGPYGYWQLSWNTPLTLELELPPEHTYAQAVLLAYGAPEGNLAWGGLALVEIAVNGMRVDAGGAGPFAGLAVQPIGAGLSPYLRAGKNWIEVRLAALSSTQYRLRGIEVWAE